MTMKRMSCKVNSTMRVFIKTLFTLNISHDLSALKRRDRS